MATTEYETIRFGKFECTISPSNVATVWLDDVMVNSIPPVRITYDYGARDSNRYTIIRTRKPAIEFIVTAWIHGRRIIAIEII